MPSPHAEAVAHLARRDPRLARVIRRAGPCGLVPRRPPGVFAALLQSITCQQLSGRAAATIHGRVLDLFGPARRPSPARLLALPPRALRAAGLSGAKTLAVRDLARHAVAGRLPTVPALAAMTDDEIVDRLTVVRGVGRWTVEMLLIFRLGRPDVLPLADLGIRKGFARLHDTDELPDADTLAAHGERWRPWRSVASWYLWRACELPAG